MIDKTQSIIQDDQKYVIHPYSNPSQLAKNLVVKQTMGCQLILQSGQPLIDGMSSWWSAIHGYNHPKLVEVAQQQINQMPHVMFGGITHEPATSLAKALVELTPTPLRKVFFADSGSVAVEVAIKIALQYWQAKKENRKKILTVRKGYHGDTFIAMSVTDPVNSMHSHFKGLLTEQLFAPEPRLSSCTNHANEDIDALEQLLKENQQQVAAMIIEPVVQGAGGMRVYHSDYLIKMRQLANQNNTLLIFDEIATGFGRTGKLFASEHTARPDSQAISSDILCLGKAITGGFMSLSACLMTEEITDVISKNEPSVIMHGPTFMANPLACSVANASIELLLSPDYQWQKKVQSIESYLQRHLLPLKNHPQVEDVRVIGALGVVECKKFINNDEITDILLQYGVWLRPFGKLLYTMPPYIISEKELDKIVQTIIEICNYLD